MKRKIRLTESELTRLIKRVISEQTTKQVTVTVDCTAKTLDTMAMTQPMITKYCATAQAGTTTKQTLAQEYKMTKKDQTILTRAELDSIGAFSADVILDSTDRVTAIVFKMKNVKNYPESQGGGVITPTYSAITGSGRVAGQVSQADAYEKEQPGVKALMQALGKKQLDASNSFK